MCWGEVGMWEVGMLRERAQARSDLTRSVSGGGVGGTLAPHPTPCAARQRQPEARRVETGRQ